jgi:2-dehydropantoate 2-reductase
MKDSPKIYLCGLGAIGSIFAGKIHETNPDWISVIVDKKRREEYGRNAVIVNGKPYTFKMVLPEAYTEPADLILIAVKQHQLFQCIKDINNFVGRKTVILSLLNGITS